MPRRLRLALLVALALPSSTARADLPPPEENTVCEGKKAGDACEANGASGACVSDTCSRLDYSNGSPPETVNYECLRCQPGAAAQAPVAEAPAPEKAPAPEAPAPAADVPPTGGGCSVAGPAEGAPLLLLVAFVVGGLARRRRR